MTMYLVVPQLKNRQMEIEHGCYVFYPLADDRRLLDVVTLIKQDTSKQTHLRSKLRVKISIKIRLKELSLDITRTISKKNSPKSFAEVMRVK